MSFWTDWIREKIKQSTEDADADNNAIDDADVDDDANVDDDADADDDAQAETGEDYQNPRLPRWREKVNLLIHFISQ